MGAQIQGSRICLQQQEKLGLEDEQGAEKPGVPGRDSRWIIGGVD